MTDSQTPKTTPAAKATPARKPAAAKAPAAKTAAVKPPVVKAAAVKSAAAKTPAAPATAAARKPATRKTPSTAAPVADVTSFAPVEPAAAVAAPATAPAGWYQVSPDSATQRYWDGTAWTEHISNPAAPTSPASVAVAPATARPAAEKAPDGTNPNTIWFWLTSVSLVIAIASDIASLGYINALASIGVNSDYISELAKANSSPAYWISVLLGLLAGAAFILFPILDWLALRKRGVPSPFSWAWSLFSLVLSSPIVYVIGRSVVVKRRTGKGLAPLWVFVALQVVTWIVGVVLIVLLIVALTSEFGNLRSASNGVL